MSTTRSAMTRQKDSAAAARELATGLSGETPRLIIFFAGIAHDGAVLGRALEERYPGAQVLGCSTNGEFCDKGYGVSGAAALALSEEHIGRCAVALADVGGDLDAGMRAAAGRLSAKLGQPIRKLDPQRWIGLSLLEGARGREERINVALGNIAPYLPFIGGSAGDNFTYTETWTWADGALSRDGTALLVAEMHDPFQVFKTCNFVATDRTIEVTRCDPQRRLILEIDGLPAVDGYARAIEADPAVLDFEEFLTNPLGLMIEGEPWLRSVVRKESDALLLACSVVEGSRLNIMRPTDLIAETQAELQRVRTRLGGPIDGAIMFNCVYRMLEARFNGIEEEYHRTLSEIVHVGMQSNGETYLGHINQTLTGLAWR